MKIIFAFLVLVLGGCSSGDNNITEVGNPTRGASSTGTTSAITNGVNGVLDAAVSGSLLTVASESAMVKFQNLSDYECTYDDTLFQLTCTCPVRGDLTVTFDEAVEEEDNLVTFNHTVNWSFGDCVVDACDEEVPLNGEFDGNASGSFDTADLSGSITVTLTTQEECSGMTSGETTIGFGMILTTSGLSTDYSGAFCIDGDVVEFGSLVELLAETDPENVCGE